MDSGPLVALLNRRDQWHAWVLEVLQEHAAAPWTCEPVLAEAAYLTGRTADIVAMVAEGALRVGLKIDEQADFVERLLRKYGARMDLADACVVRLSEMYRDSRVLTIDREDFSIYRRNGREVIPLIVPPE
jgi:predicted nucleic acid-binding protein